MSTPNFVNTQYLIDSAGNPIGGTFYFYISGTTTLAPIYSDSACTVSYTNPFTVAAGSPVPSVYLKDGISYRRLIQYTSGGTWDMDPFTSVSALNYLPLSGGTISGNLNVTGNVTSTGVSISTSPGIGTIGGVIVHDAPGNSNSAYLEFVNNAGSVNYSWIRGRTDGLIEFKGGCLVNGLATATGGFQSRHNGTNAFYMFTDAAGTTQYANINHDGSNLNILTLVGSLKLNGVNVATVNDGIGSGQTWQDMSGSRALGTSYQNTTGRPIMVAVEFNNGGSTSLFQVSNDNATWVTIGTGNFYGHTQIVIPNGSYYRVTNGGGAAYYYWTELR